MKIHEIKDACLGEEFLNKEEVLIVVISGLSRLPLTVSQYQIQV
jgi:hypothetical protein